MSFIDAPDENTFRILIATDNHLGYNERDPIRGQDTFKAFEEVLAHAKASQVDFLLLGGDLFHHNKPSRATMMSAMEQLRRFTFGDRTITFQMINDPAMVFSNRRCLNFEDPNVNIALPIFSIHGNHDDPSGLGGHAALDILDSAQLLNYFGKYDDVSEFTVVPILLRKGNTRLALYGIGSIRDERLHRSLAAKKVQWARPEDSDDPQHKWFNVLVLHQNRTRHSAAYKNSIPEGMLPKFFDLVIWAHEHECKIQLEESLEGCFFITQPGSSAPTSLCAGEQVKKHVGVLEVRGQSVRLTPLELCMSRPFVIDDMVLSEHDTALGGCGADTTALTDIIVTKIEKMIRRARVEFPPPEGIKQDDQLWLPLIRLRVNAIGYNVPNLQRIGQRFIGLIANPDDVIQMVKRKSAMRTRSSSNHNHDESDIFADIHGFDDDGVRIEDLVEVSLCESKKPLAVIPEAFLSEALHQFVEKGESKAIEDCFKSRLKAIQSSLQQKSEINVQNVADLSAEDTNAIRIKLKKDSDEHNKAVLDRQNRVKQKLAQQQQQQQQQQQDVEKQQTLQSSISTSKVKQKTMAQFINKNNDIAQHIVQTNQDDIMTDETPLELSRSRERPSSSHVDNKQSTNANRSRTRSSRSRRLPGSFH